MPAPVICENINCVRLGLLSCYLICLLLLPAPYFLSQKMTSSSLWSVRYSIKNPHISESHLGAALDVFVGTTQQFSETARAEKKNKKKTVSSLYLWTEEKHEQIDSAPLLLKSDKWSQKMRLWGSYQSRVSWQMPAPQKEACCCATKVWELISMYVWNASKMSLTLTWKWCLKGRGKRRERDMGLQKWMLAFVVLGVAVGMSS